mgnify:FL=1|jgi:hypothetical protein
MGPENKNEYTVYWDGVPLGDTPIAPGIIHNITVSEDALTQEAMSLLEPMEFTMHIKTPKRWRCRGRKRFIKLMMSEGVSRNYAERLADFVRGWMPYGEAWREYLWKKL